MKLSQLAKRVRISCTFGASLPWEKQDEWQREANGYRVVIRYGRRQMTLDYWMGSAHTREPDAASVLSCLLSDADALQYSFEEWAANLGYDPDSRKAERIYQLCVRQGERLKRLLGDDFETFTQAENDI